MGVNVTEKKAKKKKTRDVAHDQGELAGMRPKKNVIVEKAMLVYLDAKGDHKTATTDITNAKAKLFKAMKEQKVDIYKFRKEVARITFDEDVEVKHEGGKKEKK